MSSRPWRHPVQPRTSRAVHVINEMSTRPVIAVVVGLLVVGAFAVIAASGFDHDLQFVFATVCSGATVTMVFVLQHAQRREQAAVQLKLNEIVRAMPRADDHLIGVEASSDRELVDLEQSQLDHHAALRVNGQSHDEAPRHGEESASTTETDTSTCWSEYSGSAQRSSPPV
jgi:low affinity Fe/Cu permease